jgi:hypothetical protein
MTTANGRSIRSLGYLRTIAGNEGGTWCNNKIGIDTVVSVKHYLFWPMRNNSVNSYRKPSTLSTPQIPVGPL